MTPHGYTDSEWAKMNVKSVTEITGEKVREAKGAEPAPVALPEALPEALEALPEEKKEVPEVKEEKVEKKEPAKRGRPAKVPAKGVAKKEKKAKRGRK